MIDEDVEEILRRSGDRAFVIGEVRSGAGVDLVGAAPR